MLLEVATEMIRPQGKKKNLFFSWKKMNVQDILGHDSSLFWKDSAPCALQVALPNEHLLLLRRPFYSLKKLPKISKT